MRKEKEGDSVLRQFQAAMALMSVIPLLGLFYIIGSVAGLDVFVRSWGLIAFSIICVSLTGMILARILIASIFRQLDTANRQLLRASETKTAFLRNVAHEAATPLATARVNLTAIQEESLGPLPPAARRPLALTLRQVDRLTRMVAELLDIARIEKGALPMSWERTDLNAVLGEAADIARTDTQPVRWTPKPGASPWFERGDRDRLVQVTLNLLRNAQKYSPEGSPVDLELEENALGYAVRVLDRGDGVPDDMKERVFDPFIRNTDRGTPGLGLGLAISRHIVELHRGRLWVEDRPGGGSAFIFTLPK